MYLFQVYIINFLLICIGLLRNATGSNKAKPSAKYSFWISIFGYLNLPYSFSCSYFLKTWLKLYNMIIDWLYERYKSKIEKLRLILTRDLKMKNVYAKIILKHFNGKQEMREMEFGHIVQQDCGRFCPLEKR
jgi:hypothetical protein